MDTRAKKSVWTSPIAGIRGLWFWLRRVFLEPRSVLEDDRRKEFILNAILLIAVVFMLLLDAFVLYDSLVEADYRGISLVHFSIPVLAVVVLLVLSRAGYFKWLAYITIAIFCSIIFYSARTWGMDLPAVLLGYALVVTASSVLVGTRFGIIIACAGIFVLAYFGYQEIQGGILPDHYWKSKVLRTDNVIEYSAMLFYLAVISALSNSETDKSLKRARRSEAELTKERDNLEITVEQRTRQLHHSHAERLLEQAQFAELGQLAGGYVHDLVNPLTTLSLSMGQLQAEGLGQASTALQAALNAGKRMETLLVTLRKQIRNDSGSEIFSLNQELKDSVQLLGYTARAAGVELKLELPAEDVEFYGSPSRFHQIAANLIINAIESYINWDNAVAGILDVAVNLALEAGKIKLTVSDRGSGIDAQDLEKVFSPFFSTKNGRGLGIGLPTVKAIVEKDFGGSISVSSAPGHGTTFVVAFPTRETSQQNVQ